MLSRFRRSLSEQRLPGGGGVLVAVSGGADSVCMLHLFLGLRNPLRLKITVAHFNHRLRGRHSSGDAAFVRRLSERHGCPFVIGSAPHGGTAAAPRRSLQEAAREERLAFLLREARRLRCRTIALGHTADDQAETMLMRFLAGSGPQGIGGIPPVSHDGRIIHPLLPFRRSEIEAWLADAGHAFRSDASNFKEIYLRNRIRRRLLPHLVEDYNPNLVDRLNTLAVQLRRDSDFLDSLAAGLLRRVRKQGLSLFLPADLVAGLHPALLSRLFLAALRRLAPGREDFGGRHVEALLDGRGKSRFLRWNLPGGIVASSDRRGYTFTLGPATAAATVASAPFPVPGRADIPGMTAVSAAVIRKPSPFDPRRLPGLPGRAALDWDRVAPPFELRRRRPGDRYRPFGMAGTKKLKEIFIDAKVPRPERDGIPVVCDARGIIWVAGCPPAHRCRVTAATEKLLLLRTRGSGLDFCHLP